MTELDPGRRQTGSSKICAPAVPHDARWRTVSDPDWVTVCAQCQPLQINIKIPHHTCSRHETAKLEHLQQSQIGQLSVQTWQGNTPRVRLKKKDRLTRNFFFFFIYPCCLAASGPRSIAWKQFYLEPVSSYLLKSFLSSWPHLSHSPPWSSSASSFLPSGFHCLF